MTDTQQLAAGTYLGEYRIDSKLGQGGFGVTYAAYDTHLDKRVAIKEYLPVDWAIRIDAGTVVPRSQEQRDDYDWGLERFLDEARALGRFDHPHINRVHRFFEDHGTAYLVLEYIDGEPLSKLLRREGALGEARTQRLLDEIGSALEAIHGAGYVHRDIKPDNILLRADGSAVLVDFGAARQAVGGRSRSITSVLTPGYAPVEQYATKASDIGPWTDIYALGMVAYRCITGVPSGELVDAPNRARAVFRGKPDPLPSAAEAAGAGISVALLTAIDRAIRVDEHDRPRDVATLRECLAGAGSGARGGGGEGEARSEHRNEPRGEQAPRPETLGADLHRTVRISADLAAAGGKTRVRVPDAALCDHCAGSGVLMPRGERCDLCAGSGEIGVAEGEQRVARTCPRCEGVPTRAARACPTCSGQGFEPGEQQVEIRVPQGMKPEDRLRFRGLGVPDPAGGQRGTLYIGFEIRGEGAGAAAAAAAAPAPGREPTEPAPAATSSAAPSAPAPRTPIGRVMAGEFGLPITYWLFMVAGTMALNGIAQVLFESRLDAGPRVGGFVALQGLYFVYSAIMLVAVWNATRRHEGRAIWRWLARAVVVLSALLLPFAFLAVHEQVASTGLLRLVPGEMLMLAVLPAFTLFVLNVLVHGWLQMVRQGRHREPGVILGYLSLAATVAGMGLAVFRIIQGL